MEGAVYNCDGTSFGNGSVVISQKGAKDNYVVPIVNGKFNAGNWLNGSFGETKLSFHDAGGSLAFEVNSCLGE